MADDNRRTAPVPTPLPGSDVPAPPSPCTPPCKADDGAYFPDGDTSLDPDETNVRFRPSPLSEPERQAADHAAQMFRHSFWLRRRHATIAVLNHGTISTESFERFASCGTNAWVCTHPDHPDEVRVSANCCRSRWCEACAGEKRRVVTRNVREYCAGRELRFLTLTTRSTDGPLVDALDHLIGAWRKLRHTKEGRQRLKGGVAFVEITFNQKTRRWHPHLHVLYEGAYFAHEQLKQLWLLITKDSYIVDIRRVPNAARAAGYVAKYAAKAIDHHIWQDSEAFHEAVTALRGRRTIITFGTWVRAGLTRMPPADAGWAPIAPLYRVLQDARGGKPESIRLVKLLMRCRYERAIDPRSPPT